MGEWREHIDIRADVMTGKPIIKGTRLTVEHIVDLLARGWSEGDLREEYPGLSEADIRACLAYAAEVMRSERVFPAQAS